ncbi:UNVERIFIED_CONTAM: hypothetical protein FKN15_024206 [Acipenser sinensis]
MLVVGDPKEKELHDTERQTKHAVDFGSGGILGSSELQACSFIVPALGRPDVAVVIITQACVDPVGMLESQQILCSPKQLAFAFDG